MKIIIKSWKPGFKKVIFTQLQMDLLGMSLKDAKSNVDKILDDKEVVLIINEKILQRSLDNFISLISFKKGKIWKFLKAKIFWSSLITSKRM